MVNVIIRRRTNIIYLQETKWAREKTELDNTRIKLWYAIKVRRKNGVGILWTGIGRKMWWMYNG